MLWVEATLHGTPLNLSTCLRLVSLLVLFVATALAGASCEAPSVGDTCSSACSGSSVCEPICTCGNASCFVYTCVTAADGGGYVFADGSAAPSCSQP